MGNNKKSYHQDFFLIDVETKLKQITDNTVLILIMIGIAGLIIRFCYFPYDIPFTYDALDYFSYAVSMSQSGHFPDEWALANNGWPAFVSIFFSTMNYENFIDYTHMQRILSLTISVLTIIPIYHAAVSYIPFNGSFIAFTIVNLFFLGSFYLKSR